MFILVQSEAQDDAEYLAFALHRVRD